MAHTNGEATTHYVAELQIKKVEKIVDRNRSEGKQERTLDEVTKIVLKAGDLDKLKERLAGHIELVEED